jgi:hypothetical protein
MGPIIEANASKGVKMIDLGVYDAMKEPRKSEEEQRDFWARQWAKHKKRREEYEKELELAETLKNTKH